MKGKITKRSVDALKAAGRPAALWDTEVTGFGCIAHPSGAKVYVARYFHAGRDRRMTLGRHGELAPSEARDLARDALGAVRKGRDPLAEREDARAAARDPQTVEWAFRRYIDAKTAPDARPRPWRPTTAREVERILESEVKGSRLGKRPLREVTTRDVETWHGAFMRRERPAPYAANRALAWLKGAMRYAIAQGHHPGPNPAAGVVKFEEQPRDRALTLAELARLGEAMDALVAEAGEVSSQAYGMREKRPKRGKPKSAARDRMARFSPCEERREKVADARDAVWLLALTGLRRDNVLALRWREVDFEERLLALESTKGGRKVKGLGPEALAILERRREAAPKGAEWVFPARRGDGPLRDTRGFVQAAYAKAGIKGAVAHHVLRSTFASAAGELGFSELIVAGLLGHAKSSVTSRYVRLDAVLRTAEEAVQARIAAALARKPAAEVVALPGRDGAS